MSENILPTLYDTLGMSSPFSSVPSPLSDVGPLISSQSILCKMYPVLLLFDSFGGSLTLSPQLDLAPAGMLIDGGISAQDGNSE